MKLFDKYLLSCTNQRIPMPKKWQKSLGLDLTDVKQTQLASETEITGYRFQQDDTIDRGFVHNQVTSLEYTESSKYLISLYLQAIAEHKGTDYTRYFLASTTTYEFPYYTTRANVLVGCKYSIYGNTIKPLTIRLINTATDVDASNRIYFEKKLSFLSSLAQEVIDVDNLLTQWAIKQSLSGIADSITVNELLDYVASLHEYLALEVISYSKVRILQGVYNRLPLTKVSITEDGNISASTPGAPKTVSFTASTAYSDNNFTRYYPILLPRVAYNNSEYSDKLIPALLDIAITKNSPPEERELLDSNLLGSTAEEKIRLNTTGIYDIDEFIGNKISF